MQEVTHAARLALALALAAASPSLQALVLGDLETRSALGEALDARIPFRIPEGASVDATCFALVREPGDGSQALGEGVLTIERRRGETALRIRTLGPVLEPAVNLRVRAACPGTEGAGTRQYSLLLDPRPGAALAAIAAPTVAAPPVAARLNAREGDTLESVAAKVYPRSAQARGRYLEALRDANPALAAQESSAAIAAGTPIALPDMRGVARARRQPTRFAEARVPDAARELAPARAARPPPAEAPRRPRAEPKPRPEPKEAAPPKVRLAAAPDRETAPQPEKAQRPERRAASRPAPGPGFVLKLSSSEVDLSRSRRIDDRMRAQLRERLLVLDADDQVAAMLSMRNSLKQLEARVAEMQLKLDGMPASLAARSAAASPPPAKVEPPKVEPPRVEPPKVAAAQAPKIEPPAKVEPAPPPKPEPPAARVEPPAAKVEPVPAPRIDPPAAKVEVPAAKPAAPPAKVEPAPAKPVTAPELRPGSRPVARTPPPDEGLPDWLWAVVALIVAVAAFLGWRLWRRRRDAQEPAPEWAAQPQTSAPEPPVQNAVFAEEPIEVAPEVRPEVSSDATLATRLPGNARELRRRYIEERFPEIQNRTVLLEDPVSVVKAARLFYEDGAVTRAVELLQFAIEDNPREVRIWLALFEIFRLERLTGQFAELAQRFREHHGKSDYWRKVQYFGREIDSGNALYRGEPLNTLETIGPREAKRLAAGLSSVAASASFDPIAENWLNAPMDFENEVLANELRRKLMNAAALTDQDLVPNPMPALRSVEMFTVA